MADTANDTYPFIAETPADRLIWLANSKLSGDALHAEFKATHAALREVEATDLSAMMKQQAWHERMAAECDASGAKFTAAEHRGWAEECRVNAEAIRSAEVVKASLYLAAA